MDTWVVAAITHEFHLRIDSTGPSGDWRYLGLGPALADRDGLFVGRAVEHVGIDVSVLGIDGANVNWLIELYVEAGWQRVLRLLTEDLGDNGLFVSLWGARTGAEVPLADGTWDIRNAPTVDASIGWQWLAEGAETG